MKQHLRLGMLVLYLLLPSGLTFHGVSYAAEFLHVHGEDIVGDSGKQVMLRGVGLGNWMLPEGYMWRFGAAGDRPRRIEKIVSDLIGSDKAGQFWKEYRSQYVTERDIQRIAELGFNSVRPALNARLFLTEGENPVFVDEGFELLDNLVRWCKQNGIYVIIDMHAAPGGQTGQNIDDSANDQPLLFSEPKNQDSLVKLWAKIATRYKDEPTVAAYDLLNEPLPERTGAAAKYKDQLEPLYRRITRAIRAIDKRHMITLEGYDWANNWSVFSSRFDDNLVYQFHYYCWDNPTTLKGIRKYLTERKRLGAPVWVGETGEKDDTIYWATTEYFETNNIGWSFWPWKKMVASNGPYSVNAPEGWDAIAALTRNSAAPKPDKAEAQKILDQLLQNIRLENCVYHPDVVNALLRRVPGKVEAENYGHQGKNNSYLVKDDSQRSSRYRLSEPVQVEPVEPADPATQNTRRRSSSQAIKLSAGEWTSYEINSAEPKTYAVMIKVKTEELPAALEISINEASPDKSRKVDISQKGWQELKLDPADLLKGLNHLKLLVRTGTINIDWTDFR
jgi:endoglucanase